MTSPQPSRPATLLRAWFTPPVIAFLGGLTFFSSLGWAGLPPWSSWPVPLRWALAAMFLLTASARLSHRRAELIAMVPATFPRPAVLVAITGALEALGAVGLLLAATAPAAGWCLAALMLAMFPANVAAARSATRTGGRPATPLRIRTVQQIIFIGCAVLSTLRT